MKKLISLLLTVVFCFCMVSSVMATDTIVRIPSTIPGTDIVYDYVENITVQIPGTNSTFELFKAYEKVGLVYINNIPVYRFAFIEDGGKAIIKQDGTYSNEVLINGENGFGDAPPADKQENSTISSLFTYHKASSMTTATREIGIPANAKNVIEKHWTYIYDNDSLVAKVEFYFGFGGKSDNGYEVPYDLISLDGVELIDISNFLPYVVDSSLSIVEPTKTVIRYKDGIILHAEIEKLAEEITVEWTADNDNFKMKESDDGLSCTIISNSTGDTVVTATLYDDDGNILGEDSIEMTSKAGFFDKIGGFFRSLFGTTKIYES